MRFARPETCVSLVSTPLTPRLFGNRRSRVRIPPSRLIPCVVGDDLMIGEPVATDQVDARQLAAAWRRWGRVATNSRTS